jgi:Zn-dependent protease with chaperone function
VHPAFVILLPVAALLLFPFASCIVRSRLRDPRRATPLDRPSLRRRLEEVAGRAGVAMPEVLVMGSPAGMPGPVAEEPPGLLAGQTERSRLVVLSRGLIDGAGDDGTAAVFAHEISHIRLGHPRLLRLLAAGLILLAGPLSRLAGAFPHPIALPVLLAALAIAWRLVANRLSRRFELEADLEAASLVGVEPAIEVLRWAAASGDRSRPALHPSFESRRLRLEEFTSRPEARAAFDRVGRRARLGILTFTAMASALYLAWAAIEILR